MKKILKSIVYSFALSLFLSLIFIAILIYFLPSSQKISTMLTAQTANPSAAEPVAAARLHEIEKIIAEEAPNQVHQDNMNPVSDTPSSEIIQKAVDDLLGYGHPLSEVCENLKYFHLTPMDKYDNAKFNENLMKGVSGDEKDPLIQSLKPIIRQLFALPAMKTIVDKIKASTEADETYKTKLSFYAQIPLLITDLIRNKQKFEETMDRTYHLAIMIKALQLKPQLLSSSELQNYCVAIEQAINSDIPAQWGEEKGEFEKFIEFTGLSHKELGYDPQYRSQLKLEYKLDGDDSKIQFHGGWIDDVLSGITSTVKVR